MVLMKVFNDMGDPVVLEVQPQHVGSRALVLDFGVPRFARHSGAWMAFTPNGAAPASPTHSAALDDMRMEFAQSTGWGFQLRKTTHTEQGRQDAWVWCRPTKGAPYSYETEREALEAAKMCYGSVPNSLWRTQSHGWTPAPESITVCINVVATSTPCEDDEGVEGRYEVMVDAAQAWFAAEVALDIFHARVGINVLDDFEIAAIDSRTGLELARQEAWEPTEGEGAQYLGKIEDTPFDRHVVEIGRPGGALYACLEPFAENEQAAIRCVQRALGYPEAGLFCRATRTISFIKGARP